jgi:hypothetical protein
LVFSGWLDIPIIDVRQYLDRRPDMHHSWASLSTRARIQTKAEAHKTPDQTKTTDQAHITDKHWQQIWVSEDGYKARWDAFFALTDWLDQRKNNPALTWPTTTTEDRCLNQQGELIAQGPDVWNGPWNQQLVTSNQRTHGSCLQQFPPYSSSRQQAGADIRDSHLFCTLISIEQAIEKGIYQPLEITPYIQTLKNTFPQGVCDYGEVDPNGYLK